MNNGLIALIIVGSFLLISFILISLPGSDVRRPRKPQNGSYRLKVKYRTMKKYHDQQGNEVEPYISDVKEINVTSKAKELTDADYNYLKDHLKKEEGVEHLIFV